MPLNASNVHDVVSYHAPSEEQVKAIGAIREGAESFMNAIFANTPMCADQTAALRKVREAMMTANAAIVLDGKV